MRGGFASHTKTGRKMQYGAAVGAAMARGTSSSEELGTCGYMLYIVLILLLVDQITKAANKYQAQ
uniref:Uncharacterized protein n=1 Tax=viral metagenome TaxID=1070528 RepID=A0A6C0I8P1_9ZZZZ